MELQDYWKVEENGDDTLGRLLKEQSFMRKRIEGPLEKLKNNLLKGIIIGIIITLGYAWLIFYFPLWQVQIGLLVCIGFNIWLIKTSIQQYQHISIDLGAANVLETLLSYHSLFRQWFRQQEWVALFIYPVAAAAGFMLGGTAGSGKTISQFMSKPAAPIALIICILVLEPLCYYLTKWMNQRAFGQYVDQLNQYIDELQLPV